MQVRPASITILVVIGAALLAAGLIVPFPGSMAPGWQRANGTVASVVGKRSGAATLYYATVQYQALGYSYETAAQTASAQYPTIGAPVAVAFNPEEPQQARLVSEAPPNYFRWLLAPLGALSVLTGAILALGYARSQKQLQLAAKPAPALPAEDSTPAEPQEASEAETPEAAPAEAPTKAAAPRPKKPAAKKPAAKKATKSTKATKPKKATKPTKPKAKKPAAKKPKTK